MRQDTEEGAPPPVLLVPGWSDRPAVMRRLRRRLIEAGWAESAVDVVGFRDRFGSNVAHAEEVAEAAGGLLARTGARRLDVVAHSMGGLAVRLFLAVEGCPVRRVVFVATPHAGTWAALAAWGGGRREMMPGSEFLCALPPIPPHVRCTTVRTPRDLRIFPGSSACVAGAHDVVVRLATHQGLLRSRLAFEGIRRALVEYADDGPVRVAAGTADV